jgi:hypothetical protein
MDDLMSTVDSTTQGNLVSKLEVSTVGNTTGETRYTDLEVPDLLGNEQCRSFTIDRWRRGEKHLTYPFVLNS